MSTEIKETGKLSKEQIAQFGVVKDNYEFLTTRLTAKDMNSFNPMVTELMNLQSFESNLELVLDDDGNFNKENIQLFTDTKVAVGKYRAAVKLAAKEIKAPQLLVNKAIISIEKKFIEEATTVLDKVLAKFEPWVKAENQKKIDKEAARDKKLIDAKNKAEAEVAEQKAKNDLIGIYNTIKYERIAENISIMASTVSVDGNKLAVEQSKGIITSYSLESLTADLDFALLSQEQQGELHISFNNAQKNAIALLNTRLTSMATAEANIALEAKVEAVIPPPVAVALQIPSPQPIEQVLAKTSTGTLALMDEAVTKIAAAMGDIPLPPGVTLPVEIVDENGVTLSNDDFLTWASDKLKFIERALEDRIKTSQVPDPRIVHLLQYLNQ